MKTTYFVAAGLLLLTLVQAKPKPESPVVCEHNGALYNEGESFMDDCNTCRCGSDGLAACTRMLCAPCLYAGPDGSTMRAFGGSFNNGCNQCMCSNGMALCTMMYCPHKCFITNNEGNSGWIDVGTTIIKETDSGIPQVCTCKSSAPKFVGYSGLDCE